MALKNQENAMIKHHMNANLYSLNVDDGEKHQMRLSINVPTAKIPYKRMDKIPYKRMEQKQSTLKHLEIESIMSKQHLILQKSI